MVYLSQLLNKDIYYRGQKFGSISDMAVFTNYPQPSLSKVVIRKDGKKITIAPSVIDLSRKNPVLISENIPFLPYDEKDFYLNEDLLDKQVIDIDGKRLVRVNDILLESNGELKVVGIDVGISGILRRMGLRNIFRISPKILPWQMIEAFDYQTGDIKINITKNKLNTLDPSEVADILEELGTKERLGVLEGLDAGRAARAIEETDNRTQEAILEQLPARSLKTIVIKMHLAPLADLFHFLNPLRITQILNFLGKEKAQKVAKLIQFTADTAGGLMNPNFPSFDGEATVKEVLFALRDLKKPEAIVVTNGNQKLVGLVYVKDLVGLDSLAKLKDIVTERKFVNPKVGFRELVKIFSQYKLRVIPVVDIDKKPLGIVKIDSILDKIEESNQENEFI